MRRNGVTQSDAAAHQTTRDLPEATVARLPIYLQALGEQAALGHLNIASDGLAELVGVNAAKVRKDLSYLGSHGTRGVGYDVDHLIVQIRYELGLEQHWTVVIVGAGNLGQALAGYAGFDSRGFKVVGVFDVDEDKVGARVGELTVQPMSLLADTIKRLDVAIGVVATPPAAAQQAADLLVDAGVTSVLNFAPTVITVPGDIGIRNVDLAVELQILSYRDRHRPEHRTSPQQVSDGLHQHGQARESTLANVANRPNSGSTSAASAP